MIWVALAILGVMAAVWPFAVERQKPDIDDGVRRGAPGSFAALSDGRTHFQWHGPADGAPMVCVHGLTTPSFVWEPMLPGLTAAGYRVLTYDLYGRGFSDRPKGAQTRSFFMRQLRDLLDHEGVDGPFVLMGYSMGGSIVTVFASEEPDRVSDLVLLAPAGITHRPTKLMAFVQNSGRVGEWLMLLFGGRDLRKGAMRSPGPQGFAQRQVAELGWRGYLPAVLSSQRNLLAETLEDEHRDLAEMGVPTIAIWGADDTVIPISAMGDLAQWNRNARQTEIAGAGHALGVTHPDEVLAALETLRQA
ncbi:MAG: alpha/beta hydrolase [Pseudomonadota bacterium]